MGGISTLHPSSYTTRVCLSSPPLPESGLSCLPLHPWATLWHLIPQTPFSWHWWFWLAQLCLQASQTSEETLTCEHSRHITHRALQWQTKAQQYKYPGQGTQTLKPLGGEFTLFLSSLTSVWVQDTNRLKSLCEILIWNPWEHRQKEAFLTQWFWQLLCPEPVLTYTPRGIFSSKK